MEEPLYFISSDPKMPPAGQLRTSWGPVIESELQKLVDEFHIRGDYLVYKAKLVKKFEITGSADQTQIKDIEE